MFLSNVARIIIILLYINRFSTLGSSGNYYYKENKSRKKRHKEVFLQNNLHTLYLFK